MSNSDGSMFIASGEMSDEFRAMRQRQESGMPPAGAASVPGVPVKSIYDSVPVSMARSALARHMDELNRKLSSADNIPNPYQFAGNGNPYLADMVRQREAMEEMAIAGINQTKAELERLGNLTDAEVIRWAVDNGHIGRHVSGGLVLR